MQKISSSALYACYAGFFVVGLAVALLGPAKDEIARVFALAPEQAGWLLSAQGAGAAAGIVVAGALADRWGMRRLLFAAALALVAGCAGVLVAPTLAVMLAALLIAGIGMGTMTAGGNIALVQGDVEHRGSALALLSMVWSIGCMLGPQLLAYAPGSDRVHGSYVVCAVLAAAVAVVFARVQLDVRRRQDGAAPPPRRWSAYAAYAAVLFMYVGLEGGFSGWISTHLTLAGGAMLPTALWAATLFWGGIAAGRALAALVLRRVGEIPVLALSALLIVAGASVAMLLPGWHASALAASFVVGIGCAPIFPATFSLMAKRRPGTPAPTLAALQAAGAVGSMVVPPLQGYVGAGQDGGLAVSVTLGALILALVLWFARAARGADDSGAATPFR